jgi:hypothetical protein
MHMGPVFCVRSLVGSSVASVSGDSPACDLALFAHPSAEGPVSKAPPALMHLTIATGCFAPQAVDQKGRLGEIKRQDGFEVVFGSLESDAEAGWRRNCHAHAAIGALENRGSSTAPTLQGEALQFGDNFINDRITDLRQFEAGDPPRSCQ